MSIVDKVNRQILFHDFYYEFLLGELKTYINKKLKQNYVEVTDLFSNSKELPILDRVLVESFFEVGKQSYSQIFSKLDITQKQKITQIIDSGKELFKSVRKIEDESEEKYEQYYTMFELIGPFLYKSFKNQDLLIEVEYDDLEVDFLEEDQMLMSNVLTEFKNIQSMNDSQLVDKVWNIDMPQEYAENIGYKLVA